ncbi:atos homolog protein A isoform X2 [Lepisosteus oculatus]|uniref:Atos homolog protein A n=1 Tax=Lepisosteus oculatus TaxID=7918 RepID=W5N7C0_LEPOC|nr:PREDICTED: protein FAM214A isoform X2 [Lepisosteus oculatus]
MKSDREAAEEYFEYDAEEFLVFLTLLITEGRTPECSVKGRTEGVHCPPAQSGQPVNTKHECSENLPQCRQARRTRSEVMLLWRNNIPIMIEVMLLPDCCYSDEGPTTDGNDINDPAVKQDALLLERWTLQPVPRQSGDRFIEEKTLLLAVRSYVFFSQLSAWLSASHGVVPRNILYRISAADEELVWNFSQPPTEHVFPVPNVSHSVALKVSVQSLPRQPNYPVLKCSIHTSLTFYGKKLQGQEERPITSVNRCNLQGSSLIYNKPAWSPSAETIVNPRKCPLPEVTSPSKAVRWFYAKLNNSSDIGSLLPKKQGYGTINGGEISKLPAFEPPVRSFKSLTLVDPLGPPSQGSRPPSGETNPLIGSLLQERQEVIARIAQHLNYCDPTAPHIPGSLFSNHEPHGSKAFWSLHEEDGFSKKSKEPGFLCHASQDVPSPENSYEGKSRSSPFDTPLNLCSKAKIDGGLRPSPKPVACRRLLLPESAENSRISEAVQDISRLIQDTFQEAQNKCNGLHNCTPKTCKEGTLKAPSTLERVCSSPDSQFKGQVPCHDTSQAFIKEISTDLQICTDYKSSRTKITDNNKHDCSIRLQNEACKKLEYEKNQSELGTSDSLHNAKKDPRNSFTEGHMERNEDIQGGNRFKVTDTSLRTDVANTKSPDQVDKSKPVQDENTDPTDSSTFAGLTQRVSHEDQTVKAERAPADVVRVKAQSPLKPFNIWKKQNRHSIDGTATNAFHPCTGLPLLSSPVPQRRTQTGCFDLDTSLIRCKHLPWSTNKRVCLKTIDRDDQGHVFSTSAPPTTSLSLLGNFEESVLNYRLEPLGTVEGFTAEVGASGMFCPSHMTLPVEVSFYSVSDDNAPSPYMGVITLESLGKRGYRVPPSGTIQVTLFNPNKTVVKMFVVIFDLRKMPANHQTFLRQRTFSIPVKREMNRHVTKKLPLLTEERTLRYLIHLRFQSSKSGKIYLHRDIRLLFSRKSMEVDSGAAYELKSYTEAPSNPPFSPRC